MRSANPTLKAFEKPQTWDQLDAAKRGGSLSKGAPGVMTIGGTVNAAMILTGLCASAGIGSWMLLTANPALTLPVFAGGLIGGLLLAIIITFGPRTAPFLAPLYAIAEGGLLGALSLMVASRLGDGAAVNTGIIFQAIVLTFGILFSLLLAYRVGLVRVGTTMQRCMVAALGGVLFMFIGGLVINMVGFNFPMFYELFGFGKAGLIGIGFSALMIVLGSLFLVWDFQRIEEGAAAGAPKYMEWYGGFSLLVTLVWLYIESLRLLSKIRGD